MKIVRLGSEKLHVTDNDKTRTLLCLILLIIGISIIVIPLYTFYQNRTFHLISPSVLIGLFFLLLGLYGLVSKEASDCSIDRDTGLINITYSSPIRSETLDFSVSQVSSIELKEITSLYYYVYRINFILNDRKSIPLTIYSNRERKTMKTLSDRIAEFLNVETQFSESKEPFYAFPPGF